jgi:hypothetical protein
MIEVLSSPRPRSTYTHPLPLSDPMELDADLCDVGTTTRKLIHSTNKNNGRGRERRVGRWFGFSTQGSQNCPWNKYNS